MTPFWVPWIEFRAGGIFIWIEWYDGAFQQTGPSILNRADQSPARCTSGEMPCLEFR